MNTVLFIMQLLNFLKIFFWLHIYSCDSTCAHHNCSYFIMAKGLLPEGQYLWHPLQATINLFINWLLVKLLGSTRPLWNLLGHQGFY